MPSATPGLTVTSDDFDHGSRLPDRCARNDDNDVPTLRISGVPPEAVELAVIVHDPDAPLPLGFTHWSLYGIPTDTTTVDAAADTTFRAGENDFGDSGWGGPRPPVGHGDHHYYFWVYVLDTEVEGEPSRDQFLHTYADHILAQNRVVGLYSR